MDGLDSFLALQVRGVRREGRGRTGGEDKVNLTFHWIKDHISLLWERQTVLTSSCFCFFL